MTGIENILCGVAMQAVVSVWQGGPFLPPEEFPVNNATVSCQSGAAGFTSFPSGLVTLTTEPWLIELGLPLKGATESPDAIKAPFVQCFIGDVEIIPRTKVLAYGTVAPGVLWWKPEGLPARASNLSCRIAEEFI